MIQSTPANGHQYMWKKIKRRALQKALKSLQRIIQGKMNLDNVELKDSLGRGYDYYFRA